MLLLPYTSIPFKKNLFHKTRCPMLLFAKDKKHTNALKKKKKKKKKDHCMIGNKNKLQEKKNHFAAKYNIQLIQQ